MLVCSWLKLIVEMWTVKIHTDGFIVEIEKGLEIDHG